MYEPKMSVILPVGPSKTNKKWLPEALVSIAVQKLLPAEIILVDDGADLLWRDISPHVRGVHVCLHRNVWQLGCADSWNIGIALARTDLCFMMGSDDWLEPECLEACYEEYSRVQEDRAYYWVTLRYVSDGAEIPYEIEENPCNAAMVSKSFWKFLGGFPIEAGLGAPDALVLSVMIGKWPQAGNIRAVKKGTPLYNVRMHPGRETARTGRYYNEIISVRDIYTREWQPHE